jgi:hypothetical protein
MRIFLSGSSAESLGNVGTDRAGRPQDLIPDYPGGHPGRKSIDVFDNVQEELMRPLPNNKILETPNLSHTLPHELRNNFLTNSLTH